MTRMSALLVVALLAVIIVLALANVGERDRARRQSEEIARLRFIAHEEPPNSGAPKRRHAALLPAV